MVSENEHSRNHELYTTETLIEQQTWISEIHNDERKESASKKQTKNF